MFIAAGALLGLLARQKTGTGMEINLCLLSAGMWAASRDIQASLTSGENIPRLSRRMTPNPLFNAYETKDHNWLHLLMQQTDLFWPAFCQAIGIRGLEDDPRFDSHAGRVENNVALISILDNIMATKTLGEWAAIFDSHGVLWAPVRTVAEVIADPQVQANEYIVEYDHPSKGRIKLVGSPIQFGKMQPKPRMPGPELGQHTEEILLELGYDWEKIIYLKEKKVII